MLLHYEHVFTFPCKLKKIVTGDTLDLSLDLGFNVNIEIILKLSFFNTERVRKEDNQKYKNKALDFFKDNAGPFFVETYQENLNGSWRGEIFCNSEPDDMGRCSKTTLSQHQKIEWNLNYGN